jgi:ectoine hydroxylase-related dioxygenase (phytanoyl-CoA dioxygenase family)
MVQLFQHPILEQNRQSFKIRKAYEELWNRTDLWVNTDRVGFNPPETELYKFRGPHLHWDVSLKLPVPFGTQGILYLADTAENQGAFTLVPGFQNKIEDWINNLPPGANPRSENLYALGAKPIAANAGDFIIWHQALPHGSSPNTSILPRFVQYINYAPADEKENRIWI